MQFHAPRNSKNYTKLSVLKTVEIFGSFTVKSCVNWCSFLAGSLDRRSAISRPLVEGTGKKEIGELVPDQLVTQGIQMQILSNRQYLILSISVSISVPR